MKITQDVRDYAAQQKGMEEKSLEFRRGGGEIYRPGR
jgi:phosphomethylpyrimidine synthase